VGFLYLKVWLLLSLLCPAILQALPAADAASVQETAIVQNYVAARLNQAERLKTASMDIDISGDIPKLKKQGRFHALRRISPHGLISYERRLFEGDGTVKNQLILRYLSADAEARKEQAPSLAVTPQNYKFKYKGRRTLNGREAHLFQIAPIKKREGMFQGEVWIDADTYLPLRESGALVKRISLFVKRTAFVRNYEIRDGLSFTREEQWEFQAVGVGKAELTVAFSNFSLGEGAAGENENQ
jgi:hypothetical protein